MTLAGPASLREPSGTALVAALTAKANTYPDTIRLSRGDPDFATPEHIVDAVRRHLQHRPVDEIVPPEGRADLRIAIAERLRRINHLAVDPAKEIVVTHGGQEAAFLMIQAVVGYGDEVIVPEPNYYTHRDAILFAGGTPVPVLGSGADGFRVDPEQVGAAITPRTRALLLVSPNNPSAGVLAPEDVRALVALAEERDLVILADDTYDQFLYEGAVHTSPASLPDAAPRSLTINTCSKTYAMTGWRLGWITGPAGVIARVRELKEATTGHTSSLVQVAALAALTGPQDIVAEMRATYTRRRALTLAALDRMGLSYGNPQGGQFVFVDVRPLGLPSLDLAAQLLERAHVFVGPGVMFGRDWDGFLRIAWLLPEEELVDGLQRMAVALRTL